VHVSRQTIQLRNNDRALEAPGISKSRGGFGPSLKGVRALAGFDLNILGDDFETLAGCKPGERLTLRLEP
jgi:hypothetical protein